MSDKRIVSGMRPTGKLHLGQFHGVLANWKELQEVMHDLVGIIRRRDEMEEALVRIEKLRERSHHMTVQGHRQYNPGWHLALDLRSMLRVSECIARAALERTESRGGHTRDDYPATDDTWGQVNLLCHETRDGIVLERRPLPRMPDDLRSLFEVT